MVLKNIRARLNSSSQKGYTLVEIMVVVGLILILLSISTTNLFNFQHTSQSSSILNSFLADVKEQQIKAMVGDTEGSGTISDYGVHIGSTVYTLFRNTYGTANFNVSLPSDMQFSTTLPNSQLLFTKGSGELSGFINGQSTITIFNTGDNSQKTITFNKYGVVISVN